LKQKKLKKVEIDILNIRLFELLKKSKKFNISEKYVKKIKKFIHIKYDEKIY
jgi:hypothetical protein